MKATGVRHDGESSQDPLPSVLHVVRPAAGGMVRHLDLLCRGLQERGYYVSIAAPLDLTLSSFILHPSSFYAVPITARPHPIHDLRAALRIARLARTADMLHGHGLRGAWIAALAARRAQKPFVFTAHNLAPQ